MDKELQELLDKTYTELQKAGKSESEIESATRELYTMYNEGKFGGQQTAQNTPVSLEDRDTIARNIVRGVAKPFLKATGALSGLEAGIIGTGMSLVGQGELGKQLIDRSQEPIDYGYFGKVAPMGASLDITKKYWDRENIAALADIAGTSLELMSYGYNALKIPAKNGVLKTVFNPANIKAVVPFAAPFSIGTGLQETGESINEGDKYTTALAKGASTAALDFTAATAGFSLLNGGGVFLSKWGSRAMKQPIVKALSEKMTDFASQLKNIVLSPARKRLGRVFDYGRANYEKQVNEHLIGVTDALMDEFSPKVPDGNGIFNHIKTVMKQFVNSQYKQRDALFNEFLDAPVIVDQNAARKTMESKVLEWMNSMLKGGEFSDESMSVVQQFMDRVFPKDGKALNLRDVYRRATSYPNYIGKNQEANTLVRDMFFATLDDMESSIKAAGKPELMSAWSQARQFAANLAENVDTQFTQKLTHSAKINTMVDDMLSGKAPNREEMRTFSQVFSDPNDRKVLSQVFINSILDKAKMQKTPAARSKVIQDSLKWLESFGDEGVWSVEHLDLLSGIDDILKTDFSSFIVNAQKIGQGGGERFIPQVEQLAERQANMNFINSMARQTNNFRDYSKLGDAIKNIDSVENLNAILSLVGDDKELTNTIGKEIIRGIAERNSTVLKEGSEEALKQQVKNIFNDLDKIGGSNKQEIFNKLFGDMDITFSDGKTAKMDKYLMDVFGEFESMTALENMTGEGVIKIAHLLTGALYGFSGRTVPATYHLAQYSNIARKSPSMEIINKTLQSLKEGKGIKENLRKRLGDLIQQKVQNTQIPTRVLQFPLEEIFKAAADIMGVDELTDEQKQYYQDELNNEGFYYE